MASSTSKTLGGSCVSRRLGTSLAASALDTSSISRTLRVSENTKVSITEESEACVVLKDRRFRRSRRVQLFNGVKVSVGQSGGHSVSELSEVPTIDKKQLATLHASASCGFGHWSKVSFFKQFPRDVICVRLCGRYARVGERQSLPCRAVLCRAVLSTPCCAMPCRVGM